MNHRIIQKISLVMAFAGLYAAVDASPTATLSPQVASLQNLVQSLFAIQGKDAGQIFAHAYVPVPYNIHDITFVPMIPGTTAKSVVQGTPITIDAPTEAAIQAAMTQGDLVEIQMAINGGNVTFTVMDATAGTQLGDVATGTISGTVNSYSMIYSYGAGTEAVSRVLSVGAGESIQLNQVIPAALSSSLAQFASFVVIFAGSPAISLPLNVTALTAINAATKQNHTILFSVEVDTDNINVIAQDMTTTKVIGQASISNSSQLTSSACTIQYNISTSVQGASQPFSVPLEANEVLKIYATNNLISIPKSSSISNLSMNYTAGTQTNQAFQFDAADTLNINSKLQNGDMLVLELTAIPSLAIPTNPSTTTQASNVTTQNVVLGVYDATIGQILTQSLLASNITNGIAAAVTCTWNNQPAATTPTTKTTSPNAIILKVGSGLVLSPGGVQSPSNIGGSFGKASKLQQQGFVTLAELITRANSGSKETAPNSSTTKGYFRVQAAIVEATGATVSEYLSTSFNVSNYPIPRFFGINLGNDIGIGFGNNTAGTPWGCGGPVTAYTDATTSVQGGGTNTNFSQLYSKINWAVGSGVKFLMLCFDQNGNLIADLTKLPSLNIIRPASIYVFVFDGATQAFLGAVDIKPSNTSCSNCVALSAGGTGSWASNGIGFRVDWANGCGNNSMSYPCLLDINTPAAQQAITSGKSLTFAKMASSVTKLVDLQTLLLTTAGQKLQSVGNNPPQQNYSSLFSSSSAPFVGFSAFDWTGQWPQEVSLPGDFRGTGYWYNMPYYMTYGPWEFFNVGNWGQNQAASDLLGTTQIMNWGTGVSFVIVAFDANGNYIPNIATTPMAAAYMYTFDTATGQVLGLSPIAPGATRQGDPNGGQPAFNALWPSGYNTIWSIGNGNPEAWNSSPYPGMITYVCSNPSQAPASTTTASVLGAATTFSAFQALLTQAGVAQLSTVSLAGLPADFTPKIGTQYPNDLSITFGNGTNFTFGSPADTTTYLYEFALNQTLPNGSQFVSADLSGVAAQVTNWTNGLILVVLAFNSAGNMISALPSVPTQFYIFAYDAATERRLDILKIRSGAIVNVAPGSWLSTMTFALGTSNQKNATYPAALVITGPALPQPVAASVPLKPVA